MSSQHSPSREDRGIRRIAQACSNCRRKKAKCSGERPVCKSCRRLSQPCTYWDGSGERPRVTVEKVSRALRASSDPEDQNHGYRNMSKRIDSLEEKLEELLSTMRGILPMITTAHEIAGPSSAVLDAEPANLSRPAEQGHQFDGSISDNQTPFNKVPPLHISESLIDLYFTRCHNQPYSQFHEQSFRQRYTSGLLPEYLIFAVFATAIRFSHDPYYEGRHEDATMAYANSSWKQITTQWLETGSDPNIQLCQAIMLLSVIDFTAGRRHSGWLKIGLSVRIAQDLNLMMEPHPDLSITDQEERRRVFWSAYILDKLNSCGRGKPAAILDAHCHVQLPGHELDFQNGNWRKMLTLDQAFSSATSQHERISHFGQVVLAASIIGKCAQHMIHDHSKINDSLPPWDSKSEFASIYSSLLQMEARFEIGDEIATTLAAEGCLVDGKYDMRLAGPIIIAHALFHTSHCLLQHPFLLYQQSKSLGMKLPTKFLSRALQNSRDSAHSISKLLVDVEALGCPIEYSSVGYCVTVAASIHTIHLSDNNPVIQQQAADCLLIERSFLISYSKIWNMGDQMLKIMADLLSQSSSILAMIAATPRFEPDDSDQMSGYWAAVDYTDMAQRAQDPLSYACGEQWQLEWPETNGNMGLHSSQAPSGTQIYGGTVHTQPAESSYSVTTPVGTYHSPQLHGLGLSPFSEFFRDQ